MGKIYLKYISALQNKRIIIYLNIFYKKRNNIFKYIFKIYLNIFHVLLIFLFSKNFIPITASQPYYHHILVRTNCIIARCSSTAPYIDEEEDDAVLRCCISEAREIGRGAGVDETAAWEDSVSSSRTMRFIASSTSRASHKSLLNLSMISISRVLGSIRRL
jgi:hypothetical protein